MLKGVFMYSCTWTIIDPDIATLELEPKSCLASLSADYLIRWLFIFTRSYHAKPCLLHHLTLLIPVGNTGGKAHSTACGTSTPFCCLLNTIGTWIWHNPKCGLLPVGWRQNPTELYYKKNSHETSLSNSALSYLGRNVWDKQGPKPTLLTGFRNFKSCLFRNPE